jgi:Ca2+-binding RTX toxin-like protein
MTPNLTHPLAHERVRDLTEEAARARRARSGRRIRRGLLAVLLPAALAAAVWPAGAGAAEVDVPIGGLEDRLNLTAEPGEGNRVRVSDDGPGFVRIRDEAGLIESTRRCDARSSVEVRCSVNPANTSLVLRLGDGNDRAEVTTTIRVGVDGGAGNDTYAGGLAAGRSNVLFRGGTGFDTASYADATAGVTVTLGDGRRDGRANDSDEIADAERIIGSRFGDGLDASIPQPAINAWLEGGPGNDILVSGESRDLVVGGTGSDFLSSRGEIDRIDARDTERDTIDCGAGAPDEALTSLDGERSASGCETIVATRPPATTTGGLVGTLRLTPAALRIAAGELAPLRLSWRHPRGWRKLRRIELRVYRGDARVGRVTIRPRGKRIGADGAVRLVPKRSRLTRKGMTITARLAVRFDESLAGQTLTVEVEASDTRGARQLERDAGTVRVAE